MDEIMNSRSDSQEVFQRVWARVMGTSCSPKETAAAAPAPQPEPVSVSKPVAQPVLDLVSEPAAQPDPEPVSQPVAQPVMAPQPPAPPRPRPTPSRPQPCCLRQQVLDSLEQWQIARLLVRRAGNQARQMTNLAAQLHQQAKQLSTAYFLQSGVRYWPVAQLTRPRMTTYVGGLRQLYQRCQTLTEEFHTCRPKASHQDLAQLYAQLAQAGAKRCALLRSLLEQTHM